MITIFTCGDISWIHAVVYYMIKSHEKTIDYNQFLSNMNKLNKLRDTQNGC